MVNEKWSVVTEEMEQLLKIWQDDQVQRHIQVSQAIISVKAESLYYELKKQMGDSVKDQPFFLQAMVGLIGLKDGQACKILNLQERLQMQTMMRPQLFLQNWLN
jgi:hypothetical protein